MEKKTCKFNLDFTAWQTANVDGSIGFTAKKTFGENSIQTGEWAGYGDVVINEVMWMGSDTKDGDEWLELRNMTDQSINLSSWQLTKKNSSNVEALMLTIPSGKTISPNGFFLISEYNQ